MAVRRILSCDLCGRGDKASELRGIRWKDDYRVDRAGDEPAMRKAIELGGTMLCEHHLCLCCIRDIAGIAREVK